MTTDRASRCQDSRAETIDDPYLTTGSEETVLTAMEREEIARALQVPVDLVNPDFTKGMSATERAIVFDAVAQAHPYAAHLFRGLNIKLQLGAQERLNEAMIRKAASFPMPLLKVEVPLPCPPPTAHMCDGNCGREPTTRWQGLDEPGWHLMLCDHCDPTDWTDTMVMVPRIIE